MFDLHLIHIIGNGVKYYGADKALFDPLFPNVAQSMRDRMFNALGGQKVTFDVAYSRRREGGLPLITIENNEQFYDDQGMGDLSGEFIDNVGRKSRYSHLFTSQEAVINIYADNMEMVRCLQMIVQASIILFKPSLIKANYENVLFLGATQVLPDDLLFEGGASTYGRQLRYGALHHLYFPSRIEDLGDVGAQDPVFEVVVEKPTPISS